MAAAALESSLAVTEALAGAKKQRKHAAAASHFAAFLRHSRRELISTATEAPPRALWLLMPPGRDQQGQLRGNGRLRNLLRFPSCLTPLKFGPSRKKEMHLPWANAN